MSANELEMQLDADKIYYFSQNIFQGVANWRTALFRNCPQLVTYLMQGPYFADWSRKPSTMELLWRELHLDIASNDAMRTLLVEAWGWRSWLREEQWMQ